MERRAFLSIVGLGAQPFPAFSKGIGTTPGIELTAIAAGHMPQKAVLYGYTNGGIDTIFEIRSYEENLPDEKVLNRHGIKKILANQKTMLIAFKDLQTRDQCWSAMTADPEWKAKRQPVNQISVYTVHSAQVNNPFASA